MNNQMQMFQQLIQFGNNLQVNPQKVVENLIATGQINQQQLNMLQGQATKILHDMRQIGIKI